MIARRLTLIGACLTLWLFACSMVMAQDTLVVRNVANSYIYMDLGVSGTISVDNRSYPIGGHFGIRTTGGDPSTDKDDNKAALDHWTGIPVPIGSYFAIRVDTADGTKYYQIGKSEDGDWTEDPRVDDVKQRIYGTWLTKENNIEVQVDLRLVRDTARIAFTIRNRGTELQKIGAKIYMMPEPSPTQNFTRVPYFVEGTGRITTEYVWSGANVPSTWRTFESPDDPWFALRGMLRGLDATPPDRFAIGRVVTLGAVAWDYTPDTTADILDETSAMAMWWNVASLAPGGTAKRDFVTYYGLGCASEDLSNPYILAVQAPYKVNYVQDDATGTAAMNPNPITVSAWVTNNSALEFNNVTLWLNLPPGFTLADGQSATQTIPMIMIGEESSPVTWLVNVTGAPAGLSKLTVGCSTNPIPISKTVVREIGISASNSHNYFQGWQMFSVPFTFVNSDPRIALGLPVGSFDIWEWSPSLLQYIPVSDLQPGRGYWLRSATAIQAEIPIASQNASPVLPVGGQKVIQLKPGWNQIADPFVVPYAWANAKVLDSSDTSNPLTMRDALQRGILRRTLFWWDPVSSPASGQYAWSSDVESIRLMPWISYWVRSNSSCWLILDPPMLGDWYGSF